jgi:hypothetical protein
VYSVSGNNLRANKQRQQFCAVLLASGGGASLHFLQNTKLLRGGIGEGLIRAFLCEDPAHLIENIGGPFGPLYISKGRQFFSAGDASLISLLGCLAVYANQRVKKCAT